MLDTIKTYLQYKNRFCGVEYTQKDGQEILYTTILKKTKKTLDIENLFEAPSLNALSNKLPKKQPVFLIINDFNVITKCIEVKAHSINDNLVYNAFPNLNIDDFYYEIVEQGGKFFISICRKSHLETLEKQFMEYGIKVIRIALGNNIISAISNFTNKDQINSSNATIFLEKGLIKTIKKKDLSNFKTYNINGLKISNNNLLSLSGALETAIGNYNHIINFESLIQTLKGNFLQSRFYSILLRTGLTVILSTLLINFFIFNHYFNQVNTLKYSSQINEASKQDLLELNETVNKSQKMVEDMLKSSASKSSYYVNTIIQSLPESVVLSELNFHPLVKGIKKEKPVETDNKTITISGVSNQSESFSEWLNNLENLIWINSVDIMSYEDASNTNSEFNIKLNLTIEI